MAIGAFGEPGVIDAIRELSRADPLTVIVGAGVSVESGLPTWDRLVSSLLERAALSRGLGPEEARGFDRWTREREDLTGAGEVAREMIGKSGFRAALREALYGDTSEPIPGETASAVAGLVLQSTRRDVEIVTTNYDTLLERAIERALNARGESETTVRPVAAPSAVSDDEIAVRHVHGMLSHGGKQQGRLVLSDRDYHLMQESDAWQERLFRDLLNNSTCLFVGTSLTDPNLLRYLYRSGHKRRHFAVFVRQDDATLYDDSSESVRELREASQAAKWKAVNVHPVVLDYYSLSAQFVWEVLAARSPGYLPLPGRIARWRDELDHTILTLRQPYFDRHQDRLHQVVHEALSGALTLVHGDGHRRGPGERIGMSVWVLDPVTESLVNWASADRVWRDPKTLEPVPIRWASDFVATQAFCSGSLVSQPTNQHVTSRWNHVIGFPIYVHLDEGRLPVGAITLASTAERDRSLWFRGETVVRNKVIPELEYIGESLLNPWAIAA